MAQRPPKLKKKDTVQASLIKRSLSEEYIPFFENVLEAYRDTEDERYFSDTLGDVKRAIRYIARVFEGRGITKSTKVELVELNNLITKINDVKEAIVEQASSSTAVSELLSNIHTKTGIAGKDLTYSAKLSWAERRAQKDVKLERRARRLEVFGAKATALGVVLGAAQPILGPLAGAAVGGIGALYGGLTAARAGVGVTKWGLGLGGRALGGIGRLGRRALFSEQIPSSSAQEFGDPTFTPRVSIQGFGSSASASSVPSMISSATPSGMRGGGVVTPQIIAVGMSLFFNDMAHKAKWTKNVTASLKKLGGGGGDGGSVGGFFEDIKSMGLGAALAGGFSKALKGGLIGALAITAAVVTVTAAKSVMSVVKEHAAVSAMHNETLIALKEAKKGALARGDTRMVSRLDEQINSLEETSPTKAMLGMKPYSPIDYRTPDESAEEWKSLGFGTPPQLPSPAVPLGPRVGSSKYDLEETSLLVEELHNLINALSNNTDRVIEKQMLEKLTNIDRVLEKRGIDIIQTPEEAMGVSGRTDEINR